MKSMLAALLILGIVSSALAGARVAVYVADGAAADKIAATFAAISAAGHSPMGIAQWDIKHGRLTSANFDV